MHKTSIKIKKLHPEAKIPTYGTDFSAGADMYALGEPTITNQYIEYKTGIALEIPTGAVGLIFPRSSISKYDLSLANAVGVIDSDYRGEILFRFKYKNPKVTFCATGQEPTTRFDNVIYQSGDRIGQLIVIPVQQIHFIESDTLEESGRGTGGYGSTGK